MENNIVEGLFGLSPWQVRQQQLAAQQSWGDEAATAAGQSPGQIMARSYANMGTGIGRIAGGMLGMEDAAVAEAKARETALSGLDTSNPEAILQRAAQVQDPRLKLRLTQLAQKISSNRAVETKTLATAEKELALAEKALRENPNLAITEVGVKGKQGWMQKIIYDKTGKEEPVVVGEPYQTPASMRVSVGGGDKPYYTPLQTSEGVMAFNARTGRIEPLEHSGKLVVGAQYDPSLQGRIAGAKEEGQAKAKRAMNMAGIEEVISEADDLLTGKSGKPLPTGSGVGTAYDIAAGFVGANPTGAAEAQKLKAIGGALTSKMPRMEGPQSDKDTQLYKEMAGVVGDSTITRERRIAALEVVKKLWVKYADQNIEKSKKDGDAVAPKNEWSIRKK